MGQTNPYPYYWGQNGDNPGSITIPTTSYVCAGGLQVIPAGNDLGCQVVPGACDPVYIRVTLKHPRQAGMEVYVNLNGNYVNMGTPNTTSDGALQYLGYFFSAIHNPSVSLHLKMTDGSECTILQSAFPQHVIHFDAANGW